MISWEKWMDKRVIGDVIRKRFSSVPAASSRKLDFNLFIKKVYRMICRIKFMAHIIWAMRYGQRYIQHRFGKKQSWLQLYTTVFHWFHWFLCGQNWSRINWNIRFDSVYCGMFTGRDKVWIAKHQQRILLSLLCSRGAKLE